MATDVEIPGFVLRKDGSDHGRSETSLRRDFRNAVRDKDDTFRAHFIVRTKDGVEHSGTTFTDVTEFESKGLKPEWYVSLELLNSRYWEKKKATTKTQPKKKQVKSRPASSVTLTDASEIQNLQHELAIARERLTQKEENIATLESDKTFYQEELKNRRGEIDKLREFFNAVGDSAEKLGAGKPKDDNKNPPNEKSKDEKESENGPPVVDLDLPIVEDAIIIENSKQGTDTQSSPTPKKTTKRKASQKKTPPKNVSGFEKHTPNFHKALSVFRRKS
jgi:hypothetical protein